jgi:hypothetical protein
LPGWLRGGNVFMLRYALFRRGADIVFRDLLAADALVYAGYSAGACVLSPGLRGLELVDDVDAVTRMYGAQPLRDGRPCSSTARLGARVAAQSGRGGLPSRRDCRHPSATCDMSGWCFMSGYRDLVLIKWIRCGVTDRAAFGSGQRTWAGLRGQPGFLGQGGGWSRREPGVAHVFGCWADQPSYERFMAETHDGIASAQAGTYDAIEVRLFEHLMEIGERFPADFADVSLARLAYCHVRANRQAHFMGAQAEVWNPGMTRSPGMRGGMFAQRGEAEFLVLSLWRSGTDHERYLGEYFPNLRERSGAADDLDSITGDLVDLESAWAVPPEH